MTDERLERAIGFVQAGRLEESRDLLEQVLKEDRTNMPAWHWYAQTWPNTKDKIRVWEGCLRFNPESKQAQESLRHLKSLEQTAEAATPIDEGEKPKTRSSTVALWGGPAVIAVVAACCIAVIAIIQPYSPNRYRHIQPVEYYLYVPDGYSADREWPLFIGIHGTGDSGVSCWNQWQQYADAEGFILLCPVISNDANVLNQAIGEDIVMRAVDEVKKEYRIRPRMFLVGISEGAFFIQNFNARYPQNVSGLAILFSKQFLDPRLFRELISMTVIIRPEDNRQAFNNCALFVSALQQQGFDVQFNVLQDDVGYNAISITQNATIDLFRKVKNR